MTDSQKLDLILEKLESQDKKIDERKNTDNLILNELERVQRNLEKKIDKLQNNLDELNQYYRINKLENENTTLLLRMIEDLSKRVAELEKRSA